MTATTLAYEPDRGRPDELIGPDGAVREAWRPVHAALAAAEPAVWAGRARAAVRMLGAEGSGHGIEESPWQWGYDPLPVCIGGRDWQELATGVDQRARLADALLADLYGPQRLLGAGIVPARALESPDFELACVGSTPARHVTLFALDVVRLESGHFAVTRQHVDRTAGFGVVLLYRSLAARLTGDALRAGRIPPLEPWFDELRRTLADAAPADRPSPRTVILTGGTDDPDYFEHAWLASRLGYHLVESSDLTCRNGRVWLRSLGSLEPVDVIVRGVPTADADPLELGRGGSLGVPGLAQAERGRGVHLANALGGALLEGAAFGPSAGAACEVLLGEPLWLPSVDEDVDTIATTPSWVFDHVEARPLRLRLFALVSERGVSVLPGGLAIDGLRVKDVWLTGVGAMTRRGPRFERVARASLPQVDLRTSLPTRTAEALWWLGRSIERLDTSARAASVVLRRLDDHDEDRTDWLLAASAGLAALAGSAPPAPADDVTSNEARATLERELLDAMGEQPRAALDSLVNVVRTARAARSFMSTASWRVLGALDAVHDVWKEQLGNPERYVLADVLDEALTATAALAGLVDESMVRGPGWVFIDLGRRIERAVQVLNLLEGMLGSARMVEAASVAKRNTERNGEVTDDAFDAATDVSAVCELALAACDSLNAYRRLHRSDVKLDATLDLLVHDPTNPRSVRFQLDRIRHHLGALPPHPRQDYLAALTEDAIVASLPDRERTLAELVLFARGPLLDLAHEITAMWFTDYGVAHALGTTPAGGPRWAS